MATVLDLGLLKGFTDIFVWILIFVIVYGVLEVTNLLKNKGLHALFAFAITAVIVLTGGGTNLITSMLPWVVVLAALLLFVLMLGQFAGLETKEIISNFGGRGLTWYLIIPMFIILVIAWTQGPEPKPAAEGATGEIISEALSEEQQQRPFIGVLTDPKVLGLILILSIAAMTLVLLAGGGGAVK
ncbi:hypothetical protein HYU16_03700 [Candidatus Woesearchaeota archaeon]|nr:hypothetical protein [Candidatus Woesearchaeota archaeon]